MAPCRIEPRGLNFVFAPPVSALCPVLPRSQFPTDGFRFNFKLAKVAGLETFRFASFATNNSSLNFVDFPMVSWPVARLRLSLCTADPFFFPLCNAFHGHQADITGAGIEVALLTCSNYCSEKVRPWCLFCR